MTGDRVQIRTILGVSCQLILMHVMCIEHFFLCPIHCAPDKFHGSTSRNKDKFSSKLLGISTTSRTTPEYDMYDFTDSTDPNTAIGSSICNSTYSCTEVSFLPRNCFCDEICRHLEDCCWNYQYQSKSFTSQPLPPKYVFSCLEIPEINYGSPFLIVNKCPSNWDGLQVKEMCEAPRLNNFIERISVTDIHTGLYFRNTYCALCNSVTDYMFWKPELVCKEDFHPDIASKRPSTRDCDFRFLPPGPNVTYRACHQYDVIDTCREANSYVNTSVVSMCSNGGYAVVFRGRDAYKNIHCALCNGVDENILQCDPVKLSDTTTDLDKDKKKLYSYRLLVDLNIAVGEKDGVQIDYRMRCSAGEIYNPFENQCRTVFCPEPFVHKSGKCIIIQDSNEIKSNTTFPFENQTCVYVLLKSGAFEFLSGKNIRILSTGQVYKETEYRIDGNQTFVCADIPKQGTGYMPMFSYEEVTITLAGGILSLSSLLINFVIYSCFHQLRNIPGKMLMSLIAALFVANFLFLVSAAFEMMSELCIAVAIAMHYFFLASFCWMNIMDFDLWWTFSRQFTVTNNDVKSSKRFCFYSAYAWTLPLLIVIAAVSVNFANIDPRFQHWQPNYGAGVCWIRNREAMILFFMGPLLIFKLFDIIAFSATAVHIYRARKQSAMVQKKNSKCKFLIYIKLSLIMGLTWVFAFISNMAQIPALWYVFIFLNTLQGVFICLCFACTWKVFRLISARAITLLNTRRKGSEELVSYTASKSQSGKTLQTLA